MCPDATLRKFFQGNPQSRRTIHHHTSFCRASVNDVLAPDQLLNCPLVLWLAVNGLVLLAALEKEIKKTSPTQKTAFARPTKVLHLFWPCLGSCRLRPGQLFCGKVGALSLRCGQVQDAPPSSPLLPPREGSMACLLQFGRLQRSGSPARET